MYESVRVLQTAGQLFRTYPRMALPLVLCWAVLAAGVLNFHFNSSLVNLSTPDKLLIVYAFIACLCVATAFACTMILQMIFDIETVGKPLSLVRAFLASLRHAIAITLLALLWSVLWFILIVLAAVFSRKKDKSGGAFSARNAARALSGQDAGGGVQAFLSALAKGLRMIVLLCLPAIIWEGRGFFGALSRGWDVLERQKVAIMKDYAVSYAAIALAALPIAVLFYANSEFDVDFPDWVWLSVILYGAVLWTFQMFLEQVMMAVQFMRMIKWEHAAREARENREPWPLMSEIPLPSILDDVADLAPLAKPLG